jgi:hypothetical protein
MTPAIGRPPRLAEAGPPQDAPEPASQPACDGAEVHIKEGGKVRPDGVLQGSCDCRCEEAALLS